MSLISAFVYVVYSAIFFLALGLGANAAMRKDWSLVAISAVLAVGCIPAAIFVADLLETVYP